MGVTKSEDYRYAFKDENDNWGIISGEKLDEINELIGCTGYSLGLVDVVALSLCNNENIEVLHEEVLYDKMDTEEKTQKICSKIDGIVKRCSCKDRKELIIIDRYLFKSTKPGYIKLIADILKTVKFRNIVVITGTGTNEYNEKVRKKVENQLTGVCSFEIKHTNKIHDRFWIANREEAFVMGTSLNGLGGRLCYIDIMVRDDTKIVLDFLYDEGLINGEKA